MSETVLRKKLAAVAVIIALTLLPLCGHAQTAYAPYGAGQLYQFEENGKLGLCRADGTVMLPAVCERISPVFYDGAATFVCDGRYGFYSEQGDIICEAKWASACNFHDGLAAVTDDNGLTGFIDLTGETVIPPVWRDCPEGRFSDGMALVCAADGSFCYMDQQGQIRIALPEGYGGTAFEGGYAVIRRDADEGGFDDAVIDREGNILSTFHTDMWDVRVAEGTVMYTDGDTVTYAAPDGRIILQTAYVGEVEEARPLSGGYAFVKTSERVWTCCDAAGQALFTVEQDGLWHGFRDGLAVFLDFGEEPWTYYYDLSGQLVMRMEGGAVSCGRILFRDAETGLYGYMNQHFEVVIPAVWSMAYDFEDGCALVGDGEGEFRWKTYWWIDPFGHVIARSGW